MKQLLHIKNDCSLTLAEDCCEDKFRSLLHDRNTAFNLKLMSSVNA